MKTGDLGELLLILAQVQAALPLHSQKTYPDRSSQEQIFHRRLWLIAEENAGQNNVSVRFQTDDILSSGTGNLDNAGIIVSNPPYVRNSEKELMQRNVLDFEPHSALFVDDSDPLVFYRAILRKAEILLQPGGRIYFEINEAMGSPWSIYLNHSAIPQLIFLKT